MSTFFITLIAKTIYFISKILNIGSGYVWPGHIALKLNPNLFSWIQSQFPKGIVFVSGTNGKTTTTKLITHLLQKQGLKVTSNITGANLLNGILSAVLLDTNFFGKLTSDVAVFEVDEFTLKNLVEQLTPTTLVLLNLSRDQLDRHWEIDIVLDKWVESVASLSKDVHLVLREGASLADCITKSFRGSVSFFTVNESLFRQTNLVGEFNALNVDAAVSAVRVYGFSNADIRVSLQSFSAAYGRGEVIYYNGRTFKLFLAKNPASFNFNLKTALESYNDVSAILFVLNDNIPDGRDVSWIYDIEPKLLHQVCEAKKIFVSGTRALDMSVRLGYAGVSSVDVTEPSCKKVIRRDITKQKRIEDVLVFPNYSAMLAVRKVLTGRSIL